MIKQVLEKAKLWHKGAASHNGLYSWKQFSLTTHSGIHYIVDPYGSLLKNPKWNT
jgi:hypothetical protein